MSSSSLWRGAWLLLVITSVAASSLVGRARHAAPRAGPARADTRLITFANGQRALADASGQPVPIRPYRRIAAGSTLADELLLRLAEPERIVALSRFGREHHPDAHLYGQRAILNGPLELELLQRLQVELLVLNHLGAPAELARVRATGTAVFNLGEMRGLATLLPNIEALAILLGDRARGERLAAQLVRRMKAVAADIPAHARKRALYASAYAGQLFGGGKRTSYHDVLTAAGLIDAGAEFSDFPRYDPEQLLALDPDLIVTTTASVPGFCQISGLASLRACRSVRGIVGLPDALLGNPGLGMLEAAEALRERVYGVAR